jgi:hypothetical protein
MAARNSTRRRPARLPSLPDLSVILAAFDEARALIDVSLIAVRENVHSGPESVSLRLGLRALDRVYDDLDRAIGRIAAVHNASGAS